MNTGSVGDLAIRTGMHRDARKGMKRPLKLAAFGSGLAAETTLSNHDFAPLAQLPYAACFSYRSHCCERWVKRKKFARTFATDAAFCGLSEPCPPRRRSNVAALDILSINSTVIEGRVIFGQPYSSFLPRIGRVSLDNGETIRTGRRRTVFTHSNLKNTHHEKT